MTGNASSSGISPDTGLPSAYSRLAQRVRRSLNDRLQLLPPGPPDHDRLNQAFAALSQSGLSAPSALRILRQLVLERLLVLDCDEGVPLEIVTGAMTALAEFALELACTEASSRLDAVHGQPAVPGGGRAQVWIIGMGKLGARELNVSSDIDLIYVYDQDGDTAGDAQGRGRISNHEYFGKWVRAIYKLIGEATDEGFVFRVDLALRPNGNSGPSAVSLAALEEYFHVQGREWERFAWLKSRVIAPRHALQNGPVMSLRRVVTPFVFRRYLDYNVFDALRILHRQIRDHAARRSTGHPERSNDVKLSRGGIRELEFTVQLLQVVRGGQYPELRTRPTLNALQRLAHAGLMPQDTAEALCRAYVFLRRVEHRIQYLDDQQTHILPVNDADLDWIARTMDFADTRAFLTQLDVHREMVAREFDTLLGGQPASSCGNCFGASGSPGLANDLQPGLDAWLSPLPLSLGEQVRSWFQHPRVLALRDESQNRLLKIVARSLQWLQEGQSSEIAVLRLLDWMLPLLRRESYLAMLLERPAMHERLLRLLGVAKWPATYLQLHPGVIDELASPTLLKERFDPLAFEAEIELRSKALQASAEDDEETLLNLLRRAHHAEVFRTLARDLEGALTVEQVADDLSALAVTVLGISVRWCWSRLKSRHRAQPEMGIIAYGKLGGKELGYGSDLDVVFVFEDDDEQAPLVYANLTRKVIHWLTVKTGEGDLYEIDTALRPNGNSGLLVTSFQAYANYQQQRGSNTAWTWEHQAMTRARCVLGSEALRQRFEAVRLAVVSAPRDRSALREEIVSMREKIRQANAAPPEWFDIKHSAGGMIDLEFAVQFLILSESARHPELVSNAGNIALLHMAQSCGLLPPGVGDQAASAYRELRRLQHRSRLDEVPARFGSEELGTERDAVRALWGCVFETGASSRSS